MNDVLTEKEKALVGQLREAVAPIVEVGTLLYVHCVCMYIPPFPLPRFQIAQIDRG